MNKNVFLAVCVFFAVFLGVLLGIVAFFKKTKIKKSFEDLEKDDFKEAEKNLNKEKDLIVNENTKEWNKFNG